MSRYLDRLNELWMARSARERQLLLALAALLALFIAVYGVALPLRAAAHSSQSRYANAEQRLIEVQWAARHHGKLSGGAASLEPAIRQTAEASGVSIAGLEMSAPGEATLRISGARSTDLFGWLQEMQESARISVINLTVRQRTDGTLDAELVLAGGGA